MILISFIVPRNPVYKIVVDIEKIAYFEIGLAFL